MTINPLPAIGPAAIRSAAGLAVVALVMSACGSSDADSDAGSDVESVVTEAVAEAEASETAETAESAESAETTETTETTELTETTGAATSSYRIDVWADNWMAVYVDGVLVGEDSVSITTERSFNAESFTFEAVAPFTLAVEAKDFKETDSGLEYIGENNQQMGDGGIIAQVVDVSTGEVVAVTDSSWSALVVHRAPLNTDCEDDPDPDATCQFEIVETPADWTAVGFDDSTWFAATVWAADDVDPKQGYDDISWDGSAALVWGSDLEVDNTILLRTVVG